MDNYHKIQYLLNKYSTKQPNEKWGKSSNQKYRNLKILEEKLILFDIINSQYFHLVNNQVDRAIYLIKLLNFNDICPRCSNEQMICLICYYVKCEYIKDYERRRCEKAFKDFNIKDNLLDKFLVYLSITNLKKQDI